MTVLKICGGGLLVAVSAFLLSELGFRGKRSFSLLGIIIFLLIFIDLARDAIGQISAIPIGEEGEAALTSALKIAGVGHAFSISSDICAELSEGGIATALIMVGKAEILMLIIPTVLDLIEYAKTIFI